MIRERRGRIARALAAIKASETTAAAPENDMGGVSMFEEMADEQARLAAIEEAAQAAKKPKG